MCLTSKSSCEAEVLVYCRPSRNNPGTLVKEPCNNQCVQVGDAAACVTEEKTCDPKTFVPRCTSDSSGPVAEVCEAVGSSFYPMRNKLACNKDETCFSPGPGRIGCVKETTTCDPETFTESCLDNERRLVCQQIATTSGAPEKIEAYPSIGWCSFDSACAVIEGGKTECRPKGSSNEPTP